MRIATKVFCVSSMACCVLAAAPAAASQPGMIGVTTAATVISTGTPPQRSERVLEVGTDIFANERVKTSDTGRLQLVFGDGSSLLVGPNSNVTLDKYVYNPDKKTGEIVLTATQGAFRYIGGFISKKTPVRFLTGTATIGIRGGINQFTVDPSTGRVTTTYIFGIAATITVPGDDGRGITTTFARQGFRAVILPGGRISFSRMTAAQFGRINSLFERPANVELAGLPAAGGVPGAAVVVPPVANLAPNSLGDIGAMQALAALPNTVVVPAIRSFTPPPPTPLALPVAVPVSVPDVPVVTPGHHLGR